MTPKQFGPRIRTPCPAAILATSRCSSKPRGPTSAKPPLMTMATGTPAAPQLAITSGTAAGGVIMIAKSTGAGNSFETGIGWTTQDLAGRRMDRNDLAGEARLDRRQVAQEQGSGLAGGRRSSDDRHSARGKQGVLPICHAIPSTAAVNRLGAPTGVQKENVICAGIAALR